MQICSEPVVLDDMVLKMLVVSWSPAHSHEWGCISVSNGEQQFRKIHGVDITFVPWQPRMERKKLNQGSSLGLFFFSSTQLALLCLRTLPAQGTVSGGKEAGRLWEQQEFRLQCGDLHFHGTSDITGPTILSKVS